MFITTGKRKCSKLKYLVKVFHNANIRYFRNNFYKRDNYKCVNRNTNIKQPSVNKQSENAFFVDQIELVLFSKWQLKNTYFVP